MSELSQANQSTRGAMKINVGATSRLRTLPHAQENLLIRKTVLDFGNCPVSPPLTLKKLPVYPHQSNVTLGLLASRANSAFSSTNQLPAFLNF